MDCSSTIYGAAKLCFDLRGMPADGLTISKIRVELYEEDTPDSAWIGELNIIGSLPWKENQKRRVKVRIMADEFRGYVLKQKPSLQIGHGSQHIGSLDIE